MTEHKLAHILRAIADGKAVQSKLKAYHPSDDRVVDLGWKDLDVSEAFSLFPTNPGMEYRIKPKPLVKKWRWVFINPFDNKMGVTATHFQSQKEFETTYGGLRLVQPVDSTMIEVEED